MRRVITILNDLEKEGVIENYALGGAIALLFYSEPISTEDLDVFIFLPGKEKNKDKFITLEPLYDAIEKKGGKAEGEHVIIADILVQLIPAYNSLVEEGVKEAMIKNYEDVEVKVLRIEHLIAIMLQTNRPKDRVRLSMLLEGNMESVDKNMLLGILSRHKLEKKWREFLGKVK